MYLRVADAEEEHGKGQHENGIYHDKLHHVLDHGHEDADNEPKARHRKRPAWVCALALCVAVSLARCVHVACACMAACEHALQYTSAVQIYTVTARHA